MKALLLSFAALAVTTLALQAPVKAQTSGSSSTSSSGSTSSTSSTSGAATTSGSSGNQQQQRTNQRVNSTTNTSVPITFNSGGGNGTNGTNAVDPAGANGSNGSNTPGGSSGAPYYGQSDVTIRTTPTVYAPPVSGGNPCTLAVSGGVSVIGWGAAAGGTFVDKDCADRQKIAMIHNAGYAKAAQELMCNDQATYMAFKGTPSPCNPRPQWDPASTPQPMVQQQPLAPPPQQVIVKDRSNLPRCSRTVTDNCYAG